MTSLARSTVKLHKLLHSLLFEDEICYLVFDYLEKNLWEYKHHKTNDGSYTYVYKNWKQCKKYLGTSMRKKDIQMNFRWECDRSLPIGYNVEDVRYNIPPGDLLSIEFDDVRARITVKKDEQSEIVEDLKHWIDFRVQLDIC